MSGRRAAGRGKPAPVDGAGAGQVAPEKGGPRSAVRTDRRRRRRKVLMIVGAATAGVVAVAGAGTAYLYFHLNGNIHTAQLYSGASQAQAVGVEKADPFGRKPLNVLLIGSDTRDTAEDAKLGGDGGAGANADVEMIVHLSADRSNITVMSVPRDTVMTLPDCTDPATGATESGLVRQITTSLDWGPGCTAMAVHKLTGITIDDFAMVDFGGVVDISNALGGVNVCVSSNMYDIDSGLKLTKGYHSLEGVAALEFLRTRHGFGDGSDNLGRTTGTHIFFTDMINKLKNAGTITNVGAMYTIANAATKALTVSPDLGSALKLISLADDLNKVPTNRITFTTMQNDPDPDDSSYVVVDPAAQNLFNAIINDQSLTAANGSASGAGKATATATTAASAAPPVSLSSIAVDVYNGTEVDGREDTIASELINDGFNSGTAGHPHADVATSSLTYGPGQAAQAQAVAKILGLPAGALKQGGSAGLSLVIGADWTSGSAFPHSTPSAPPVNTASALASADVQVANQSNTCVTVSPSLTENKLGLAGGADWESPPETPLEMYNLYPNVPDSAP